MSNPSPPQARRSPTSGAARRTPSNRDPDSSEPLVRPEPPVSTIRTELRGENHWCFMHSLQARTDPSYRPCFHPPLMREMGAYIQAVAQHVAEQVAVSADHFAHVVIASDSDVFNLGGDLELFARLIRARDRAGLLRYATDCVEGVHLLHAHVHPNIHTVALVQGDALGGGLELALSCQTMVAESGVKMGFPEVLFGLFPGMGAYSFLSRRVSPRLAEEMILNGVIYTSDELHALGVVDVLAPRGEGVRSIDELIRRHQRIARARMATNRIRERVNPVTLTELMQITELWVEEALSISERQLKTMERLVQAQLKRPAARISPSEAGG